MKKVTFNLYMDKAEEIYSQLDGNTYIYKLENGNYLVRD